ncbi:hypothetical protein DFH06DRAFT_1348418 [Mycena polygramma]|nr:hypothetical protein DFH06DRAFT_1348418 [Mycena polygramma]
MVPAKLCREMWRQAGKVECVQQGAHKALSNGCGEGYERGASRLCLVIACVSSLSLLLRESEAHTAVCFYLFSSSTSVSGSPGGVPSQGAGCAVCRGRRRPRKYDTRSTSAAAAGARAWARRARDTYDVDSGVWGAVAEMRWRIVPAVRMRVPRAADAVRLDAHLRRLRIIQSARGVARSEILGAGMYARYASVAQGDDECRRSKLEAGEDAFLKMVMESLRAGTRLLGGADPEALGMPTTLALTVRPRHASTDVGANASRAYDYTRADPRRAR